jgi:hypothetical protein
MEHELPVLLAQLVDDGPRFFSYRNSFCLHDLSV